MTIAPKIALLASLTVTALTFGTMAQGNDVGGYSIQKQATYNQTSAATPFLDPDQPYQFSCYVSSGSTGLILTNSTLTTPSSTTLEDFTSNTTNGNGSGLSFQEQFTSKNALDTAFAIGTYNLSVLTTTPNQYTTQLVLGSDNYPPIPQITSVTNATWSGGHMVITDLTQPVTLNWASFSGNTYININNTSISTQINSPSSSYTIAANTFTSGQYYQGQLQFSNFANGSNPNPIPNANGGSQYQNQLSFIIQAGSPTSSKNYYMVEKRQVLTQTSNGSPTGIPGTFNYQDAAPYDFSIQCPAAGTVSGPSARSYPLVYTASNNSGNGGGYDYSSGAVSSQSTLDGTYLNGAYTFPDSQVVTLPSVDTFPNTPQVTLVNGGTPIWDAQGRLVLDPTISNTLTFTAFNTQSNPNWHEDAQFQSDNGGIVDIHLKAGVSESSQTPFTTLTIPANTMTTGSTYTGNLNYLLASSDSNFSNGTVHAAGDTTETYFSVLAQPSSYSGGFTPSLFFQNGTTLGILTLNPTFLPSAWQGVGAMNSGWQQGAIGSITGNGIPDIIFQNGTLIGALILNSSGAPVSWVGIGAMNAGWQLCGAGYITGDGNLDLIFQNGTLIGFLEVNSSGQPVSWNGIGQMGSGWQLRAVANLTGNGRPDLIFQNGTVLGALQVNTSGLPTAWNGIGVMGTGWTLSYAVDVTGSGQPNLIFQNGTLLGALTLNTSFQPTAWNGIGAMGSGWTLP